MEGIALEETLKEAINRHAHYTLASEWAFLSDFEKFMVVSLSVRDQLMDRLLDTERRYEWTDAKQLAYLSMEFLMGRALYNNLINTGIYDACQNAVRQLGGNLDELIDQEEDAALGNGGLGRLAACFLDSLATMDMPGYGYGINYEFGLFQQEISHGYQVERPDTWQRNGTPWLIERPAEACLVPVYGRIEHGLDRYGEYNPMWLDWQVIIGVPFDMPIAGYGGHTVNRLRLYSARSSHEFDVEIFNSGDYLRAVEQKIATERISKILYPSDRIESGQELRFLQEYFFVVCAIRDMIRRYQRAHSNFDLFADKVAVHLNDTHPALAVAELMRILVDEQSLPWDRAWAITTGVIGYTNHTLLPEALERWPVPLFERVLPRHLGIIYEINRRFLEQIEIRWPKEPDRLKRMSIIEENSVRHVRMGHLAMVGSHSINGVAELHSRLITTNLAPDFFALWPEKFNNKTNGVTPRRWLLQANPGLSDLIARMIGKEWITDLNRLKELEPYADHEEFQDRFREIKQANKKRLAEIILTTTRITVDTNALFDVQVKRIHEYKRQLLNVLQIVYEYLAILEDGWRPETARVYIFAGKAAPGYWAAKQIIKLINNVARVINKDPRAHDLLKVVFIPDYRITLAERIMPAADVSEQISTAGMEASGTGNMKFALNGALTVGTLDGANIEIREEVGPENIYIFGLTAGQIQEMRRSGAYDPRAVYYRNTDVQRVVDALNSNRFCEDEPGLFRWIVRSLTEEGDHYFHLADLPDYIRVQRQIEQDFQKKDVWSRKAILNVARIGKFSSDRTITEYARDIWKLNSIRG